MIRLKLRIWLIEMKIRRTSYQRFYPIAIGMAIFAGSVFGISHQNDDNINDKKFSSRVMTDDDFMNMSNSARSTKSSVKVKTKKNSGKSTSKSKNMKFTLGNRYY